MCNNEWAFCRDNREISCCLHCLVTMFHQVEANSTTICGSHSYGLYVICPMCLWSLLFTFVNTHVSKVFCINCQKLFLGNNRLIGPDFTDVYWSMWYNLLTDDVRSLWIEPKKTSSEDTPELPLMTAIFSTLTQCMFFSSLGLIKVIHFLLMAI